MNYPSPPSPIVLKGFSATITFDGWTVTIRHKGGTHGLGEASVTLAQLSGVELRKAGLINSGMFSLITPGAAAPKRPGLVNKNPLSVWIKPGQNKEFEALRDAILGALAARNAPSQQPIYAAPQPFPGQQGHAQPTPTPSLTDELQRLGQMVQQGLLTPEQFEQAKQQLLGGGPRY